MLPFTFDFGMLIQTMLAGAFFYYGKQVSEVSKLIALHDWRINQLETNCPSRRITDIEK